MKTRRDPPDRFPGNSARAYERDDISRFGTIPADNLGRRIYAAPDVRDPTTMREADVKEAEPGWKRVLC